MTGGSVAQIHNMAEIMLMSIFCGIVLSSVMPGQNILGPEVCCLLSFFKASTMTC
jgi:hypothetical protein